MLVHDRERDRGARLLRRRAGRRRDRARLRAGADPGPLHRRVVAGLQRRRGLVRRPRDAGRARAGASSGSARCRSPSSRRRRPGWPARGSRSSPSRPTSSRSSTPILTHYAEAAAIYAPGGRPARRRRPFPLPRARRRARAARRRGRASRSTAGEVAGAISDWVTRARRHARAGGPRRLRADRARAGRGAASPGARCCTNPPPSSGGILIAFALALLERAATGRPTPRPVVEVMAQAQAPAHRASSSPGSTRRGSPQRFLARRPARLDHPHHRHRRRRAVRERHLLERHRLRADRPRHRRARQQHARRAGPQPARLPPPRGGAPDALDDVADRRPARRRARGRARQRRLEPDPLGDPADDRPPRRRGP